MRFEEIYDRLTESQLTQEEAADLLGCVFGNFGGSVGAMRWKG